MITEEQVRETLKNYRRLKRNIAANSENDVAKAVAKMIDNIEAVVALLDTNEKEIIEARYYNGMSWEEMEIKLYISGNTIARRCRKAIQEITEALNGGYLKNIVDILKGIEHE